MPKHVNHNILSAAFSNEPIDAPHMRPNEYEMKHLADRERISRIINERLQTLLSSPKKKKKRNGTLESKLSDPNSNLTDHEKKRLDSMLRGEY